MRTDWRNLYILHSYCALWQMEHWEFVTNKIVNSTPAGVPRLSQCVISLFTSVTVDKPKQSLRCYAEKVRFTVM
jgi:hypothetical protein